MTGVAQPQEATTLVDVLERVLDKGLVIAGDIQINLLDIELLTIKIRLLIASVDKAKEMGIDWWEQDPTLSGSQRQLQEENRSLRARLAELEGPTAEDGDGHRGAAGEDGGGQRGAAGEEGAGRRRPVKRAAQKEQA